MENFVYRGTLICLLVIALAGASQASDKPAIINLMVDMDMPASPTVDQLTEVESNFIPINNALIAESTNFNWTLFLVQDASLGKRLYIAQVALNPKLELAISGNHSYEKLSTKSYEEQKAILASNKNIEEHTKVCGTNVIVVSGFKPQSYDQNEDTYKALDDLGIEYDAGFQAGIIYAPGHENDVWPYKVENHKFYAVPVSTSALSGEKVPLDDSYAKNKGLSSSQWYDLLVNKLDEVSGNDKPMVVSLSTSVSGRGDYLDAFKKFIGYAVSKKARFVKASELVSMARSGVHDVSDMSIPTESSVSPVGKQTSECPSCDQSKNVTVKNETFIVKV
jgi:hypothetical protein